MRMIIVGVFFFWLVINFLTAYFAPSFIPYLGFFPYQDQLAGFHLPDWLSGLANFDGLHYLLIAKDGYSQYEQAFFPLYPILIRSFSSLLKTNLLTTGLIISGVGFLIGLFIFKKYLEAFKIKSDWPIIFLLVFPTSFFFHTVYTEGLFFFLLVSCLYLLKKQKYFFASLLAILASTTRLIGVFLIIPFAAKFWQKYLSTKKRAKKDVLKLIPLAFFVLTPVIGFFTYCFYLWRATGDPFFFFNSQPAFGANRSTKLISLPQVYYRYLRILLTAQLNFQYFISLIELIIFTFIFLILLIDLIKNLKLKIKNYSLIGLNLFSLVNIILPTLTGTFSSIPRYGLFSLSFFMALAQIKKTWIKALLTVIFLFLHIILFGFFIQGYFIS